MTCPFDKTITHFAQRASRDQNFREEMQMLTESAEPSVKAFGESAIYLVNNDSTKSHTAWLEVLKNDPSGINSHGTWFGGTHEKLYWYLNRALSTIIQQVKTPCNSECAIIML
jgi:hypothetical protein